MTDLSSTLRNPRWRIQNLYSIVDKQGNRVKLRENPIQKLIGDSPDKRQAILKARQFGVSTYCLVRQSDRVFWEDNVNACILAHEQDSIEKLFRIPRRTYEYMHAALQPVIDRGGGSKYEMYFPERNSRIYCDLESRSDTIQDLHISEAAFIKDVNRIKATLQAVPLGGKVTFETTPNGIGNHFYDFWMEENGFKKLFFPWFLFPEYRVEPGVTNPTQEETEFMARAWQRHQVRITPEQLSFRRMKQAELKHLFIQEYPEDDQSCFLASGNAAMDLLIVKELMDAATPPIEESETRKIFERPRPDGFYVLGADVAEGVRSDFSVGVVIECKTLRQVAQIRSNNWTPAQFAHQLADLGKTYTVRGRPPEIAVERNNHGHACILALDAIECWPGIFKDKDERQGWKTDLISRPLMLDRFIDAVENRRYLVRDSDTFRECLTLIDNDGKIEADVGKHDDTIIAHSIALSRALEQSGLSALYENIGAKILVA